MRILAVGLALWAAGAPQAQEAWERLSGAEIAEALTERRLSYASGSQVFYASGRTLYDSGRPSWGYWAVRQDRYCSMWPPSDLWACYALERRGTALRFVGAAGDVTEGVYAE
ncbi:MAG: hypothetical protein AAF744_13015 [Pseudomonadota bacterium]